MKKKQNRWYLTPLIEIITLAANQGFAVSNQLPDYEEDGDIIIIG